MIAWTPALAVGIEEIDAQHQELFRRANAFVESLEGRSRQDVGIILSYLRHYAITHFGAEEGEMRQHKYPGYSRHKAQHDRFIKDLMLLSTEHERRNGPGIDPLRVGSWLANWLTEHVSRSDIELAQYLKARERARVESPENV